MAKLTPSVVRKRYEEMLAKNQQVESTEQVSPSAINILNTQKSMEAVDAGAKDYASKTAGMTGGQTVNPTQASGGVSFNQYMAASGITNPNQAYQQTVQGIDAQYERALAAYGAMGEQMARAGLAGSGYAGASTDAAYAAAQQARSAAMTQRNAAMTDAEAKYAAWLANNQKATGAVDAETQAAYSQLFSEALAGGSSVNAAKESLLAQFPDASNAINAAASAAQKQAYETYRSFDTSTQDGLASLFGATPEALEGKVKTGEITKEQAASLGEELPRQRAEYLTSLIRSAKDEAGIIAAKESAAANLSDEEYKAWLPKYYEALVSVADIGDESKSLANIFSELYEDRKAIGDEVYREVLNGILGDAEVTLKSNYKRNPDNSTTSSLTASIQIDGQSETASLTAVAVQDASLLKKLAGQEDSVLLGNKLYLKTSDGWWQVKEPGKAAGKYKNFTRPLYDYFVSKASVVSSGTGESTKSTLPISTRYRALGYLFTEKANGSNAVYYNGTLYKNHNPDNPNGWQRVGNDGMSDREYDRLIKQATRVTE